MIQKETGVRATLRRLIEWMYIPFQAMIPPETFRYAATGGLNTAFDIFLYFCFYHYILQQQIVDLGFVAISPHIASFLFVFPITFTSGFLLARYITFTSSQIRGRIQLFRYGLSVLGAILLNYVFLKFFVEVVHIWPTIAKIFTTIFVVAYSYLIQRYFTFRTGTIRKKS
ncbi:MAG: GtrA family protein [Bacteroidetes bacterium]|nr:GtrA family protein [Bacteroidota bacterium]